MSFMFKPLAYDDKSAINKPQFQEGDTKRIYKGNLQLGKEIAEDIKKLLNANGKAIVLIDGYASSTPEIVSNLVHQFCKDVYFQTYAMRDLYQSKEKLDILLAKNLPPASEEDPIQLFGYIYDGDISSLCDEKRLTQVVKEVATFTSGICIIYGQGAASLQFRELADRIVYLDVTPKTAAIRTRDGLYTNIGDIIARDFESFMRRNYFVDFEVMVKLRKELLQQDVIDYYIMADHEQELIMIRKEMFRDVLSTMYKYPFRCKPVYLEGIWGGEFIRKARNIEVPANNLAWIFEMIPMEVSIVVRVQDIDLELPFCTFFQKYPNEIMGVDCTKRFDSYFPIRCNYDDTYHSDGNMSIQVHPNAEFIKKNYNDKGAQDEAYYVIATGHGAKTYDGIVKGADMNEFYELAEKSLKDGNKIDYQKYINGIQSYPGKQFMIPAGTIHASGQNQFILELGSLTIGSYTYKIYDYLRKDAEGKHRPIHLKNGKEQVVTNRDSEWVKEHSAIEPRVIEKNDDYCEELLGKNDLMYFETRRYCIETKKQAHGYNRDQFTILAVVDGEHVRIYDKENPAHCYHANFLDIIVVPAYVNEYVIENTGYQPVVVHKVILTK